MKGGKARGSRRGYDFSSLLGRDTLPLLLNGLGAAIAALGIIAGLGISVTGAGAATFLPSWWVHGDRAINHINVLALSIVAIVLGLLVLAAFALFLFHQQATRQRILVSQLRQKESALFVRLEADLPALLK